MPSECPDAAAVLAAAQERPPTLGDGRLVCVDGPAGSGKTTLARQVAALAGAPVVHTDELLEGWGGLPGLAGTLDRVLRPLAAGRPSAWRRWDWHADQWAEEHPLAPVPLLVVEGVGSGAGVLADLTTLLVWVEAPEELRLARGRERDGEAMMPHWERWLVEEGLEHARERTRERADVLVDGTGVRPAVLR